MAFESCSVSLFKYHDQEKVLRHALVKLETNMLQAFSRVCAKDYFVHEVKIDTQESFEEEDSAVEGLHISGWYWRRSCELIFLSNSCRASLKKYGVVRTWYLPLQILFPRFSKWWKCSTMFHEPSFFIQWLCLFFLSKRNYFIQWLCLFFLPTRSVK